MENQMPSTNLTLFSIFPQGSSSANTWKLEYVCTLWTLWLVNFLAKSLLWKPAFVHGVVHFKGFSKDGRMHIASKVQVWVDDTCQNFMHVHGPWRSLGLGSSFSFVSSSPGATISCWFQGLSQPFLTRFGLSLKALAIFRWWHLKFDFAWQKTISIFLFPAGSLIEYAAILFKKQKRYSASAGNTGSSQGGGFARYDH